MTDPDPVDPDGLERLQREADQKKSEWPDAPQSDAERETDEGGDSSPGET